MNTARIVKYRLTDRLEAECRRFGKAGGRVVWPAVELQSEGEIDTARQNWDLSGMYRSSIEPSGVGGIVQEYTRSMTGGRSSTHGSAETEVGDCQRSRRMACHTRGIKEGIWLEVVAEA